MLRFTRVVALPDLKIAIFPAESILSYGLRCRIGEDVRRRQVNAEERTSQEEGLAPLLLGFDERGQAPLPDLLLFCGVHNQLTSNMCDRANDNQRLLIRDWR